MKTTKKDIKEWFLEGVKQGATHMIIVCDTYDWEDYPVYVKSGEDVQKKYKQYNGKEMQKVMEVYNLTQDMQKQLNEYRSLNF